MTETPSPSSGGRWLRVVLVLSLALNLLVAGLVVGSAWKWRQSGGPARSVEFSMGPIGRALAVEDRRAMSQALRDRPDLRPPNPREMRAVTEELIVTLRETPFRPERFAEQLQTIRNRSQAIQQAGQLALVEIVAGMSDAERAAFADRVEAQSRRGPNGDRARDGDRDK